MIPTLVGVGAFGLLAMISLFMFGMWSAFEVGRGAARNEPSLPDVAPYIAPAPMPIALPLLGEPGAPRADGSPSQSVDRQALRSLLWHEAFDALTHDCESFQDAFEKDASLEAWPDDAAATFGSAEPELLPSLDAWVAASPGSFAPYLARGTYFIDVAVVRRGGLGFADTPKASVAGMNDALDRASADLAHALTLRPKLVVAMREQLRRARLLGKHDEAKAIVEQALVICPSCYLLRVTHMFDLSPSWGGSFDQMLAFAREAPATSRMHPLAGFVDHERAYAAWRTKHLVDAHAAADRAIATGDDWRFRLLRGELSSAQGDATSALRDLDVALTLRPEEASVLANRAYSRIRLGRWGGAAEDLLAAFRTAPGDNVARRNLAPCIGGLVRAAESALGERDRKTALDLVSLALELDPGDSEAHDLRARVITGDAPDDAITRLAQARAAEPDTLLPSLRLSAALSSKGRHDSAAALWTDYLLRRPGDGLAYIERSRTLRSLGKPEDAHADDLKACDLGRNEGCYRAAGLASSVRDTQSGRGFARLAQQLGRLANRLGSGSGR